MEYNFPPNRRRKPKLLPIYIYFKENIKRFLFETSLNGLKYIHDKNRTLLERSYYLLSFLAAFLSGIYMTTYFFDKWRETPVLIIKSSTPTSIQDIPFPAVTFCNMNQALLSKVGGFARKSPDYAMLQKLCYQEFDYKAFVNVTPRFKDDTIGNFIVRNTQSCEDMMVSCMYGSIEETCTDLFREVLLDEGLCCVFNQLHPIFLYKGDYQFIRDYTSTNRRITVPVHWDLEDGYETDLTQNVYPRLTAGNGVSMGLTVIINANLDDYYCSSTNGAGFKFLVYNPIDTPHIKEAGLPISVGQQIKVRIKPKYMKATPSLLNIDLKDRQCYFTHEKQLLYFKHYTRQNCEMECDAQLLLQLCNCIPYEMPKIYANASVCFVNDLDCVVFAERQMFNPSSQTCKKHCLSGCYDLSFHPDRFETPLTPNDFHFPNSYFRNVSKEWIQQNLAVVQFYFPEQVFRSYIKVPYTGLTEFLSQTGGVLSLMVGFSIISVSEVFYFTLMKPFLDMLLRRSPIVEVKDVENKQEKTTDGDKFHHQILFKRRKFINKRAMHWDENNLKRYKHFKY